MMPVYDHAALDAPHTRRELGMSDHLVKRLELPWPADDSGAEVTLPIWVLELLAEAKDRIEALTAEVAELAASNITLSKIVTPSASHPIISRFCGLSVAEILALTARAETAEAKLAQGVRVIPLVWVDRGETVSVQFKAETPFGVYYIERDKSGLFNWWTPALRGKFQVQTLEAAKTAAQADYEARILAAIDTVPAAQIADEALERAAQVAESVTPYKLVHDPEYKSQMLPRKGGKWRNAVEVAAAIRALKGTMK